MPSSRTLFSRPFWLTGLFWVLLLLAAPSRPAFAQSSLPGSWRSGCFDCPHFFLDRTPQSAFFDPSGTLHVFYGGEQLCHATAYNTGWAVEVVDATLGAGRSATAAADPTGQLHVVYLDAAGWLRYAHQNGTGWQSEAILPLSLETLPSLGLAVDPLGTPHIAFRSDTDSGLFYAVRTTSGWQSTLLSSAAAALCHTGLALDTAGQPHVAYTTESGMLHYAHATSSGWTDTEIGGASGSAALALDTQNVPHIVAAAQENGLSSLFYYVAHQDGWRSERIDTPTDIAAQIDVRCPSLRLANDNTPHVAYQLDLTALLAPGTQTFQVRYAVQQSGSWQVVVGNPPYSGKAPSLALAPDQRPHILLAAASMQLTDLHLTPDGWQSDLIDLGGAPASPALFLDGASTLHAAAFDQGTRQFLYYRSPLSPDATYSRFTERTVFWPSANTSLPTQQPHLLPPGIRLAVDPQQQPHLVSRFPARGNDLLYHTRTDLEWEVRPVLSQVPASQTDDWDIAVDSSGLLHVAASNQDGVFYFASTSFAGSSVWLDPDGSQPSIALDSAQHPTVAYAKTSSGHPMLATLTASGWFTQPLLPTLPIADLQLAFDGADNPALALVLSDTAVLLLRSTPTGWISVTLDTATALSGPIDLAIAATGIPHVIYYAQTGRQLSYATLAGDLPVRYSLDTLAVASPAASLALDRWGAPHVLYEDAARHDLNHVYWQVVWPHSVYLPTLLRP
ncbi:MAG: hypothetical protein ACKO4U_06260 [Caldilinea sp.]